MQGCLALTENEIAECIKSFGGYFEKRDRALFVLGIYAGFRISELLLLQVKDVCQYGRIMDSVHVPRRSMKGQHASRSVPLHHHAQLVLDDWLQNMPSFFDAEPESYAFRSRAGENKPLSRVQAYRILKVVFDSCQMSGPLGHWGRIRCARRLRGGCI